MSDRKPSRVHSVSRLPIITLADVLDAIAADTILGPRQREARRSAVKTLCRWLGKEGSPGEVTAELRVVRQLMADLAPADCTAKSRTGKMTAVSNGRRANVMSLVNRSLMALRADLIDTRRIPLLPDWQDLFARTDPVLKRSCGRFARWCSAKNILPIAVMQQHAEAYEAELKRSLPSSRARKALVDLCRAWNQAAAQYAAIWPQRKFDAGDKRNLTVLPRDQIDPSFVADLELMLARFSSPLDLVEGFTRPYEERTIAELRRVMLRLYSVAVVQIRPTPIISTLADLVRPEIAHAVLAYYLAHFGKENTKSAGKYAHFFCVVAKYWVKLAKPDLKVLRDFRKRLKSPRIGMAEKNRRTLRLFEDEARIERLLFQSDKALAVFNRHLHPSHRDALELQSAVAMAILISAPVRPQNLASIAIGRHLIWGRNGSRETCHLVFPANEVKNDIDLEFKLPPWVIDVLKVYLSKARPLLAQPGNDHLFPGQGIRHKGPSLLSQQIAKTAKRVVGDRVTGHQFRHLVGFLYLLENPGGYEVVRRFLGHKRIETTIAFYVGMEQATAVGYWDKHLDDRRQRYLRARAKDRQPPRRSYRDNARSMGAK